MPDAHQLAAHFRAQADAYEQARLALALDGAGMLSKTAARYRRLADLLENSPPKWLPHQDSPQPELPVALRLPT